MAADTVFSGMSATAMSAAWFGVDTVTAVFPGVDPVTISRARVRLPQVTDETEDQGQETEYRGTVRVLAADLGAEVSALADHDLLCGVIEYDGHAYGVKSVTRDTALITFEIEERDPVRRTRPGYRQR